MTETVAAISLPRPGQCALGTFRRSGTGLPELAYVYPSEHAPVDGDWFYHVIVVDNPGCRLTYTKKPGRGGSFVMANLCELHYPAARAEWVVMPIEDAADVIALCRAA